MGGLTYLFNFVFNALIATVLGAVVSAIAFALPPGKAPRALLRRILRMAITFAFVWLTVMAYCLYAMVSLHRIELKPSDALTLVSDLVDSPDQVVKAERRAQGDTSQTYLVVRITQADVERVAAAGRLKREPYDGHTAEERGWSVPEWWPGAACPGGLTYHRDAFASPPDPLHYVINWCPAEGTAYIQNFDY